MADWEKPPEAQQFFQNVAGNAPALQPENQPAAQALPTRTAVVPGTGGGSAASLSSAFSIYADDDFGPAPTAAAGPEQEAQPEVDVLASEATAPAVAVGGGGDGEEEDEEGGGGHARTAGPDAKPANQQAQQTEEEGKGKSRGGGGRKMASGGGGGGGGGDDDKGEGEGGGHAMDPSGGGGDGGGDGKQPFFQPSPPEVPTYYLDEGAGAPPTGPGAVRQRVRQSPRRPGPPAEKPPGDGSDKP